MAHFKAMEAGLARVRDDEDAISIVCYDPYEWPATVTHSRVTTLRLHPSNAE